MHLSQQNVKLHFKFPVLCLLYDKIFKRVTSHDLDPHLSQTVALLVGPPTSLELEYFMVRIPLSGHY